MAIHVNGRLVEFLPSLPLKFREKRWCHTCAVGFLKSGHLTYVLLTYVGIYTLHTRLEISKVGHVYATRSTYHYCKYSISVLHKLQNFPGVHTRISLSTITLVLCMQKVYHSTLQNSIDCVERCPQNRVFLQKIFQHQWLVGAVPNTREFGTYLVPICPFWPLNFKLKIQLFEVSLDILT